MGSIECFQGTCLCVFLYTYALYNQFTVVVFSAPAQKGVRSSKRDGAEP